MIQIISGLKELKKYDIIHRNLRLNNILVKNNELKISGFSFCTFYNNGNIEFDNIFITNYYKSPQLMEGQNFTFKTDIYSAGIICYEIANKRYPFDNFDEGTKIDIYNNIRVGNFLPFNSNVNEDLKHAIIAMLSVEEEERPDSDDLINQINKI